MLNGVRMQKIQPDLKVLQQRMKEAQMERRQDLIISLNQERKVQPGSTRIMGPVHRWPHSLALQRMHTSSLHSAAVECRR
jgi:hypothetical protein